jgi:hypothetical protein
MFRSSSGSSVLTLHSKRIAAIIGGAVGGGILITVLVVLYYRQRARQHQRHPTEVDLDSIDHSFQPNTPNTFSANPPRHGDASHDWLPSCLPPENAGFPTSDNSPSPIPPKSSMSFDIPAISAAAVETSEHSSSSQSPQPVDARTVAHAFANPVLMEVGTSPTTNARLTQEQSELVQDLIRHDIPLVTVAGVMKGMLRTESGGGESSGSRVTQSGEGLEAENPPDYDFV